jgi:hypothetical protein
MVGNDVIGAIGISAPGGERTGLRQGGTDKVAADLQ